MGMKTAYEKDKQVLAELNQKRARKFEELRQSARTVDANNVLDTDDSAGVVDMIDEQIEIAASVDGLHPDEDEELVSDIHESSNG